MTVYKKDGTVENPELCPEYAVEDSTAGINISNLGPYYTEIKYFINCLMENRPIEVAPLSEGVKSVELALEEWEAAKEYIRKHQ